MRLLAANDGRVPELDVRFFFVFVASNIMSALGLGLDSQLLALQFVDHGKPTDAWSASQRPP